MAGSARLLVIMYHYVRQPEATRFPRLKTLSTDHFRRQIDRCASEFEIASLESALAFVTGRYRPSRHLCLLTFDDGLREHYTDVLPMLSERRMQGLFFITTDCLEGRVASVHKSHFLMAGLGFDQYRAAFRRELDVMAPDVIGEMSSTVPEETYRWDTPEVVRFKYLLNFQLPLTLRDRVLDGLFDEHIGTQSEFARELYLDWDRAREMQTAGMVIGGHARTHVALPTQDVDVQREEIAACLGTLHEKLLPQTAWPFSYPYGSQSPATARLVSDLGFACAFTTEAGANEVGQQLFQLRRYDTNDVLNEKSLIDVMGSALSR